MYFKTLLIIKEKEDTKQQNSDESQKIENSVNDDVHKSIGKESKDQSDVEGCPENLVNNEVSESKEIIKDEECEKDFEFNELSKVIPETIEETKDQCNESEFNVGKNPKEILMALGYDIQTDYNDESDNKKQNTVGQLIIPSEEGADRRLLKESTNEEDSLLKKSNYSS